MPAPNAIPSGAKPFGRARTSGKFPAAAENRAELANVGIVGTSRLQAPRLTTKGTTTGIADLVNERIVISCARYAALNGDATSRSALPARRASRSFGTGYGLPHGDTRRIRPNPDIVRCGGISWQW